MSLCRFAFPFALRLPFGLPALPSLPTLPSVSISIPELGLHLMVLPKLPFGLPALPSLPSLPVIALDLSWLGLPGFGWLRVLFSIPFGIPSFPSLKLPWITLPPCVLDGEG